MHFKDHFSRHASDYAKFRPCYPKQLFEYLTSLVPSHELAWDCATGSGQAASALTNYFDWVIATDASQQQLQNALKRNKIKYVASHAEHPPLRRHSTDLITVAQATLIPIMLKTYRFGPIREVKAGHWVLIFVIPIILQLFGAVIFTFLYPKVLALGGVSAAAAREPFYSFPAAFAKMFAVAAERWPVAPAAIQMFYLLFIVAWAGLGEELFYRGYMHGVLRKYYGVIIATVISAFFFGIRHYTQLFLLWPDYPWAADCHSGRILLAQRKLLFINKIPPE